MLPRNDNDHPTDAIVSATVGTPPAAPQESASDIARSYEVFSAWIDAQLEILETRFADYISPRSLRSGIRRTNRV